MLVKRNLKRRQDDDRRQKPDRRNGYDRRLIGNGVPTAAEEDAILNTKEACDYLKISRPTFLNYIIAGCTVRKEYKILKDEFDDSKK